MKSRRAKKPARRTSQRLPLNFILLFIFSFLVALFVMQPGSWTHLVKTVESQTTGTCKAKDPNTMKSCLNLVTNGSVSTVEVTATISCQSASACAFLLDGIRRPVTIKGSSASYGFKRSKVFNYSFRVANSDGITFRNLRFTDETNSCNPLDEQQCSPMILFNNSTNITVDKVSMNNARRTAIAINASSVPPKFTITNSSFTNEAAHAITTYVMVPGGYGRISGNTFSKNVSNAIAFNVAASATMPSIIENNTFVHNHRGAIYRTCGDTAAQPCPGGQLYFPPGAKHVIVRNNTFKDGYADVPTANSDVGVAGIEVMHNNNHYIAITGNLFQHNSTGIMINYDTNMSDLSDNITITDNTFYNNINHDTYFFNYPLHIDVSRNIYK